MPRSAGLISPSELKGFGRPLCLLDARAGERGRRAFVLSHLEGALHADLEVDLARVTGHPEVGGRHPLPPLVDWTRRLGDWGIGPSTAVVVYDDAGGANAAARLWWMLRAVGHRAVWVLDGGLAAAIAAGLETAEGEEAAPEVTLPPYPVREWCQPTADADEVERRRLDTQWRVVDVRDAVRFRGESEPFDPVPGHVPGAINLPYRESLDDGGRFLSPEKLRQRFDAALDVPPSRVIVYCGSGVTACHTLLAMETAGLSGSTLYVGSWSEWCRSERPKAPGSDG